MAWEQRRERSYYYLKMREGARVRSVYVGRGDLAQTCAETAEDCRQEQECLRAHKRQARQAEADIDRQLKDAEAMLATVVNTTLCAAGYHKHKGQWRRKRHA